jgi:hypothetical protein
LDQVPEGRRGKVRWGREGGGGGTGEDSLVALRSDIKKCFFSELPNGHLGDIQHTKTGAVVGLVGVAVVDVLIVVCGGGGEGREEGQVGRYSETRQRERRQDRWIAQRSKSCR